MSVIKVMNNWRLRFKLGKGIYKYELELYLEVEDKEDIICQHLELWI